VRKRDLFHKIDPFASLEITSLTRRRMEPVFASVTFLPTRENILLPSLS
jgi:hypothetical protein